MDLEFTQKSQFQPVNRETWGRSDVLHCLVFFPAEFPWSSKALQPWTLFLCCAHIPLAQAWNGMLGMSPPSKIFLDQAYPFSLENLCCTAFASPTFIFLYTFEYGPNHENSRAQSTIKKFY